MSMNEALTIHPQWLGQKLTYLSPVQEGLDNCIASTAILQHLLNGTSSSTVTLSHYVFNAQPRSCLLQYMENTEVFRAGRCTDMGGGKFRYNPSFSNATINFGEFPSLKINITTT